MVKVKPVQNGRTTRMSFSHINEVIGMPNLIEIQKNSYNWFLEEGLHEVFHDIAAIEDYTGNLVLEFVDYRLDKNPKYSIKECKERDATYAAPLYVTARLFNKQTGEVKEQEIFMGDFPLMTDAGTFISNGAERAIVSQLVRSPGVFYGSSKDRTGKDLFTATMNPNRGAWLEYETDSNDVFYVHIDKNRKIPVTVFIRALGLGSDAELLEYFGEDERIVATIEKDITIVCVGAVENPSDCVACCGTHPSTAGQVGLLKIFKVEPNKGMFRVYFEAGRRAFLKYQEELDVLTALCNKLSAGTEDVLAKYESAQEKNRESRTQLHLLKKEVLSKESASILSELIENNELNSSFSMSRHYSLFSLDDLSTLAREIGPHIQKVAFLVHDPSHTVFLVSNGRIDCGKLVKENASIYNGKGGGNATLARAIFAKDEYVTTFIDLIEKHLR